MAKFVITATFTVPEGFNIAGAVEFIEETMMEQYDIEEQDIYVGFEETA